MNKSPTQLTERYIRAVRELINSKAQKYIEPTKKYKTFSYYIKNKLGLIHSGEWGFFCACMDLIEDTNLAIENFLRFEIEGPTKYDDVGEKYLRLYGFLNAVYMQQNSVLTLCKIFKISDFNSKKQKIVALRIREIRNKLASHSNSYGKGKKIQKDTIFLARISLSHTSVSYGYGNSNNFEDLDLLPLLQEHSNLILELMDDILEKGITFIYKSNKKFKDKYLEKLDDLRQEREGNLIIKLPKGKKLVVSFSHRK